METADQTLPQTYSGDKRVGEDTTMTTNHSSRLEASSLDSIKNEKDSENIPAVAADSSNDRTSPNWERPISNLRWSFVVIGIAVVTFLYGLDTTVAGDVQGPILQDLGEIQKLSWVGLGFPMGSLAVILLCGKLNGLFNIKYLFIIALVTFEVGSAVCGAAPNMNAMICGRVIAGIGGCGVYISALTYIAVFANHREAALVTAMIGICWGTGAIIGPIVGGGFSSNPHTTWRWAFYINLPLAAVCAPIYIFLFPPFDPQPSLSTLQKLLQVDWVGATLNALVFTIFQVVLTVAGSTFPWSSAGPIVLWIIFGLSVIAFVLQQRFSLLTTPANRLFPIHFLRHRSLLLLYFGSSCAATGAYISVYYIPLFFQFTKGDSAIHAAVRLLPFICVMVTMVMLAGASLPKIGRYQLYYLFGGAFLLIGGALMHTVDSQTSVSKVYGYEVLIALGVGSTLQTAYSVAAVKVVPTDVPSAIGFINVAQIGSNSLCLAIAGCIFQNVGFNSLKGVLGQFENFPDEAIREALAGTDSAILQGGDPLVRKLAVDAVVSTISKVWIMVIAAGALSFVSALCMKRERLQFEVPEGGA